MNNSTMEKILAKYLAKTISQKNANIERKAYDDMEAVHDVTNNIRKTLEGYAKGPATDDADAKAKAMGYKMSPLTLWQRIKGGEIKG